MEMKSLDEITQAASAIAAGNQDALDRLMWTGVFGRSFAPRGAAAILSATSIPEITSPKAEYWPSRKFESLTTMKNCEEAELGSDERAMDTIPRLCGVSLNSALIW